jgi:hypothetical protein
LGRDNGPEDIIAKPAGISVDTHNLMARYRFRILEVTSNQSSSPTSHATGLFRGERQSANGGVLLMNAGRKDNFHRNDQHGQFASLAGPRMNRRGAAL